MRCCGMDAVLNTALGKPFFYCRECKTEVTEKQEKPAGLSYAEVLKYVQSVTFDTGAGAAGISGTLRSPPFYIGSVVRSPIGMLYTVTSVIYADACSSGGCPCIPVDLTAHIDGLNYNSCCSKRLELVK